MARPLAAPGTACRAASRQPRRAAMARAAGADRSTGPGERACALGVQVSAAAWVVPLKSWINVAHVVAARRRQLRPVHLPAAYPGDLLADRAAVPPCPERPVGRLRRRRRPVGRAALAADPLVRPDRRPRGHRASRRRPPARPAGGLVLPLSRGVRPVGERDGDALLDRDRGAAWHRAGRAARHRRVPPPPVRARDHAVPRPHADGAGVRLSGADPVVLRLQSGGRDDRDDHLRHAADGPEHRAGAAARAGGGRRFRPDGRLHAAAR